MIILFIYPGSLTEIKNLLYKSALGYAEETLCRAFRHFPPLYILNTPFDSS